MNEASREASTEAIAPLSPTRAASSSQQQEPTTPTSITFKQRRFRESTIISPDYLRPPYVLQEVIGEGSYGRVYRARHKRIPTEGAQVAVKIVPIEGNDLEVINKEIEFLRKIGKTNFVVAYHGNYQTLDGFLWIVMELCDMGSVLDILTMCAVELKESEICDIMACTVLGLAHLHAQKLIHRDVKCGNILLTRRGGAKLADFGISAQFATMNANRHTTIGTPYWMAPEVIQGDAKQGYNEKCDVWSLGISLIEIAEGAPPLAHLHPMRAVFLIPTRTEPTLKPDTGKWSQEMHDFLSLCLVKDVDKRTSAKELLLHPFIRDSCAKLLASQEGTSENIQALACECAPMIEKFLDKKHREMSRPAVVTEEEEEDLKSTTIGDTLRIPITPAYTNATRAAQKQLKQRAAVAALVVGAILILALAVFIGWWKSRAKNLNF